MQVCFPVRSMRSFLVTPLPKRLRGGNTACGCPCPSPFLSLFLSCSLYLIFPLVLSLPRPLLPISVCLCCFLRSEHCCATGLPLRNKATFSIHVSCLSSSLLFLCISPAALFFHFYPPFSISISSPSTRLTISTIPPLSPLILMAALVWN